MKKIVNFFVDLKNLKIFQKCEFLAQNFLNSPNFEFCTKNSVYLVTGSDRDKTLEQIGTVIYNTCKRVYNCSGNDVWEKDKNIFNNDWTLPKDCTGFLQNKLNESRFPLSTGLHFEHRPGMVNFSVVGRNATIG